VSNSVELPIAKAINAGLREAMRKDEKVLVFGQDVAELGGVFRVTEGLHAEFGQSRIFNSPIAESGIVGTAIGLAMRGYSQSPQFNSMASFFRPSIRSLPSWQNCKTAAKDS
jgi:2-oxoisovalerate dehydrogenase E1 component beta subunit